MPNLLFIHTSAILGGSEKAFLDLINQSSDEALKKVYFILPGHGPLEQKLNQRLGSSKKVFVKEFPSLFAKTSRKFPIRSMIWTALNLFSVLAYVLDLKRFIRENDIEIVYSNGIKCHVLTSVLKRFSKINVVWHLQDFFPHIRAVDIFLKLFGKTPDLVIANSQSVLDDFIAHLPVGWKIDSKKVVHNSVDPKEFLPSSESKNGPLVISLVAMLTPWKGQEIFIEAMAKVIKSLPGKNIEGWIVGGEVYKTAGESGYAQTLKSKIEALGLQSSVLLRGLITDVQKIYRQSEIVVHCSTKPEPFGRVIIEAMSSGCAVVAARAGGVVEIIDSGRDGLLVTPGNSQELADAIVKLVTNDDLRKQLSAEGRNKVVAKFSAEKFAHDIFSELRELR